jgi:1,4-alpha-glucan branching enzyme
MTTFVAQSDIDSLVNAYAEDVFRVLGLHEFGSTWAVNAFLPGALAVEVLQQGSSESLGQLQCCHPAGVFSGAVALQQRSPYRLRVTYPDIQVEQEDPYRFPATLSHTDLYLFNEGTHERLYRFMGAHVMSCEGVLGTRFCVWAPNAQRVSVVGSFNFWDGRHHMMRKHIPSGVWELFIPGVAAGALYKYEIRTRDGELLPQKSDPYGFAAQCPPQTASEVVASGYAWSDGHWQDEKSQLTGLQKPMSIYEVHLGSWRRVPEEGNRYLSYQELAEQLIPYVKGLGFTHIQLMPISEYPFDGSWGYQPIGLFAPTRRFGTPDDFRAFVDACHQAQLGVLIDWVPGHFPSDAHGLARFDGTPLYEHADHRQGYHPDWNTYIYNYGRHEVANFLFSNALYWFDEFHIDGLRVDAVASMLYLDYSRNAGEWIPNTFGGRENLEAIDLLRRVNAKVYEHYPYALMIAEESTAWPGVSHPIYAGGLGFGYKWNMGWMNDTLRYMSKDPVHRQYHHHDMTFSLLYAFNENFILPLSHDEVVHGKGSLLDKMPGDGWQKFANLRAYLAFMWAHPGKKLLFMGGEFAQGREWNHDSSLDWHLLEHDCHRGMQQLIGDLNQLYRNLPALHWGDAQSQGFEWVDADDRHLSMFAFLRKADGLAPPLLVVCNMTPVVREDYRVGVSLPGYYRERLNTDASLYGGSDQGNAGGVMSEAIGAHGRPYSLSIRVPPLATVVFELT